MRNSMIIIKKQLKDTLKNKTILIQFILLPLLTIIMENAIHVEGMPELYFTKLFSVMYIGMAPLTAVAAIIAEEKEKNTLHTHPAAPSSAAPRRLRSPRPNRRKRRPYRQEHRRVSLPPRLFRPSAHRPGRRREKGLPL